jgi:two-component system invasion response regulator UvrY
MITVMIVNDDKLIGNGVTALLSDLPNIEVIAKTNSGEEAILLAKKLKPNVILMDIRMPGIGGIAATRKITVNHPDIKIIALTSCAEEPFPTLFLQARGHGYLTKGATIEKMGEAIRTVAAGKKFLEGEIAQKLALKKISGILPSPFEQLSAREFDILVMLNNGLSPKAIAKKLFISIKTVHTHRSTLFEKLNVRNDVELILFFE